MPPVILIFSIFIKLIFPTWVSAQILINEILNNPEGPESGSEWIELLNSTTQPLPLANCILYLDDNSSTQKVIFSGSDFIDKFKVISWDGSWLNNSGDVVKLDCVDSKDQMSYGNIDGALVSAPSEGVTIGRYPDATGSFSILATITQGSPNSLPPTSTSVPTQTPLPTARPSPTAKPNYNTPTSYPRATPTLRFTVAPSPTNVLEDPQVLGSIQEISITNFIVKENSELKVTPTSIVRSDKEIQTNNLRSKKFPLSAIIMGGLGIGSIIFSLLISLKNQKLIKNNKFNATNEDVN